MTTATRQKKIYQVAKEINISHETLIEYLVKRGHSVRSHMSAVDDQMLHDILSHFKKDKEVAEKHQRKIQIIRETKKKAETKETAEDAAKDKLRRKVKEEPAEVEAKERPATPGMEIAAGAVELEDTAPEIEARAGTGEPPAGATEGATVEAVADDGAGAAAGKSDGAGDSGKSERIAAEAQGSPGAAPKTPVQAGEQTGQPGQTGAAGPAAAKPGAKPEMKPFRVRQKEKFGLKVMGKIDLEEVAKKQAAASGTAPAAAGATDLRRKKKKKRIRSEATVTPTDDTPEAKKGGAAKRRGGKGKTTVVNKEEVTQAIRRTLAEMDESAAAVGGRQTLKKKRKEKRALAEQMEQEAREREKSILRVTEFVSVHELANLMGVPVADVIKKCIALGLMVSINQRLDRDTITLVAGESGFEVQFFSELAEDAAEGEEGEDDALLEGRPPVVTIMGHVDHGKTSLLDYIRKSNVVAGESGGITQHIGAYQVSINDRQITFLDTPGHEAFTAMRARGAQMTDIVILVVAADDNVMPQTIEAISHAQAAAVPIVIAMNKTDKPDSNTERIRQQLSERNVLVEEWGGKYQSVEISAKTGKNVQLLLEKILVEAEVLDLKAVAKTEAKGVIIEARVDKGKGTTATVLVQRGTLRVGDPFVAGIQSGRVRAMFDERGHRLESAGPSAPVQILGFDGIPQAGDILTVAEDEREAREISIRRQQLKREQDFRHTRGVTLDDLSKKIQDGMVKELKVVVKGDVDGSIGALADSLMKITHEEVRVNVIHRAVGAITESDVLLAAASGAFIIGFHVRPNLNARVLAEKENVDIRLYDIIYDAIEDVKKALEGLLSPEKSEEITATLEVREVFKIPKIGAIAGCYVQQGTITRGNRLRLVRDGIVVYEGAIGSLKRFKDDVREVVSGFECGVSLEKFNDIKKGDTIEAFKIVETQRTLTQ